MRPLLLCLALCAACHHPEAKKEAGPAITAAAPSSRVGQGETITREELAALIQLSEEADSACKQGRAALDEEIATVKARHQMGPDDTLGPGGVIQRGPRPASQPAPAKDAGAK